MRSLSFFAIIIGNFLNEMKVWTLLKKIEEAITRRNMSINTANGLRKVQTNEAIGPNERLKFSLGSMNEIH